MEKQHSRRDAMHHVSVHQADNLTVRIFANRVLVGDDAAEMVGARIKNLLEQQEFVNVIFASAPSQNEFLDALIENTTVDWKRVNAFHMDEYIELPEND